MKRVVKRSGGLVAMATLLAMVFHGNLALAQDPPDDTADGIAADTPADTAGTTATDTTGDTTADKPGRKGAGVKRVVIKATKRVRRSLSLGPTGGAGLVLASEGGADAVLSFGLGFFWFQDTLLDISSMREDIKSRVQKKLMKRLVEMGTTEQEISKAALDELRAELWEEVKAEFRERLDAKPSATPKPRLNLQLEGAYLPRADAWQVRGSLGIGISKITVAPVLIGHFGDVNAFGVGGEAAFHYLLGSGNRPIGLQFFVRYDYHVNNRDTLGHQGALGVRTFLDII